MRFHPISDFVNLVIRTRFVHCEIDWSSCSIFTIFPGMKFLFYLRIKCLKQMLERLIELKMETSDSCNFTIV